MRRLAYTIVDLALAGVCGIVIGIGIGVATISPPTPSNTVYAQAGAPVAAIEWLPAHRPYTTPSNAVIEWRSAQQAARACVTRITSVRGSAPLLYGCVANPPVSAQYTLTSGGRDLAYRLYAGDVFRIITYARDGTPLETLETNALPLSVMLVSPLILNGAQP